MSANVMECRYSGCTCEWRGEQPDEYLREFTHGADEASYTLDRVIVVAADTPAGWAIRVGDEFVSGNHGPLVWSSVGDCLDHIGRRIVHAERCEDCGRVVSAPFICPVDCFGHCASCTIARVCACDATMRAESAPVR